LITERNKSKDKFLQIMKYSIPIIVIASFFILQKIMTGNFCCIYPYKFELFHLDAEIIINKVIRISKWLFFYQYRYIFTILIILNLILIKTSRYKKENFLFLLIIVFSGYSFSFLYFLPRYLLPVLPYLCIMCAWSIFELTKTRMIRIAFGTAITALMISSLSGTFIKGNNEWNMKYLGIVNANKKMYEYIKRNFPNSVILTTFPHADQMRRTYLGYVEKPLNTVHFKENLTYDHFDLILISNLRPTKKGLLGDFAIQNKMYPVKSLKKDNLTLELYGRSQNQ